MAEVVDSIVAELVIKGLEQYEAGFNRMDAAHKKGLASLRALSENTFDIQAEGQKYKAGLDAIAGGEEQATSRVVVARKKRTDADKAAAAAEKALAKERAAAAKEAAKAEADAAKAAEKATADRLRGEQAYQVALARVREGEIQSARRQREELNRLRSQEAEGTAQARASSFLAPLGSKGLSGTSARSSADVFRQAFKDEEQAAKLSANKRVETEQETQARLSAAVDRGLADRAAKNRAADPATSSLGRTNRYDGPAKPLFISEGALSAGAAGDVAAQAEIDRLKVDQITSQSKLNTLKGGERREVQDNIAAMRLERQLRAENVAEEEILLRLESLRGAQTIRNAREAQAAGAGRTGKQLEQFARGSGFYAATGGPAAIAGIGVAAGVAGGIAAVDSSISFAKQISDVADTTGISTKAIQVYQAAARQAGATNEQVAASFGRLNDYIGRAKEGDEQAAKTFSALGISLKGVRSAGDALPTVVDRLSQIKDPAERAAVGTRIFGEEYRRLDAVLGQGTAKIDALGNSLERTGSILSGRDIATLKDASAVLGELKARLEVDLARVVAGNAQAILGLANAFANLADKALKAVQAIGRIKAQNVIADESAFAASSPAEKAAARSTLIADPQGRQFLLQRNSQALATNRQQLALTANSPAQYIDGKLQTPAATYQAERRRLLAERREVLTYRDPGDISVPVTPGKTGDVSGLFAPKGPKGKSATSLAEEAEARTKRYLDQLSSLQEAELRGQESLTGDINKRAEIETDLANRALKKQTDDIESTRKQNVLRGADPALEKARADTLVAAAKVANATQLAAIAQDKQAQLIAASNAHVQTRLSIEAEQISAEAQLATTRKQRLALELKALANQTEQERANLTAQRDSLKPGDPARADLDKRLGSLDATAALRRQGVEQGNESPLEAYKRRLHEATDDTGDAIQNVEVNALGKLEDQLSSSLTKVLGLKGAFGDLFGSILADLAKIEIEKGLLGVLGGKSASSDGGLGGLFGTIAGLFGGKSGGSNPFSAIDLGTSVDGPISLGNIGLSDLLPGFANGGSATIGGNPGVDQNILSINGRPSLRVGQGEQLTVTNPNIAASNRPVAQPQAQGGTITVHVQANDYFDARVAHVSGPIAQNTSVRVVRAAAPGIAQAGASASPAVVRRQQTLGS